VPRAEKLNIATLYNYEVSCSKRAYKYKPEIKGERRYERVKVVLSRLSCWGTDDITQVEKSDHREVRQREAVRGMALSAGEHTIFWLERED
jgi:hypothetical protein